ncbi:hypothetical protein [Malaciobacter canalis]|uniref:hypothetical protein n=1 Tax=Malaciobacter canalis TaxID=1912871 RepID=UPI00384D7DD3
MSLSNKRLNHTELINIISKKRLDTYNDISEYVWNSKLSENFFFILQNLEVGLRNSIYNAYKKSYPKKSLFYLYENNIKNRYLSKKELHSRECWKMLCAVKHKLNRNNQNFTDDDIVAELNFGFWTKLLLDKHYTNIWRKIFKDVFPNLEFKGNIDQAKVHTGLQFDDLRKFRNRIFHYEPIFNKAPKQYHDKILESTKWINDSLYEMNMMFDEFEDIYNSKDKIKDKIGKN